MSDTRSRLDKQWRLYKDAVLDIDDDQVAVVIRRPPRTVAAIVLDSAMRAGEVDADGKPTGQRGAIRLLARVAATTLFEPGAARPMYNRESEADITYLTERDWLLDVQDDCTAAFASIGLSVERLKGNSEATRTSP